MYQHHPGNFLSQSKLAGYKTKTSEKKKFLVQIITQKVFINDEPHVLTLFKDITFGVLYEQIKAKESLQNMIDNTLYQKICVPLKTVVKTCMNLEQSQDLNLFEQQYQKSKEYNLRFKLGSMRRYSELIVYRLNDIRDWQLLQ